jgi:hypothetical protein
LEVWAKVGELDRANLKEGQEATLQLDAIPDKRFNGKIKAMSGTATSDVFSGDPSKKFDIIFSIDMRQLLTGLGMKQADVDRIMATAEANAKKDTNRNADPFAAAAAAAAAAKAAESGQVADDGGGRGRRGGGGGGGNGGGGGQRGQGGGDNGGRGADGRGGQGGGGGRFGNMSDADRQKMTELRQKMQNASDADREKLQKEMQDLMTKNGMTPGQGRGPGGPGGPGGFGGFGGGGGRGGRGGGFGNGPEALAAAMREPTVNGFTGDDRKSAKLPLPPEQDSQAQVLLRPGLLSDVEIQVEKLADVIHVPAQAVFTKNGQYTVYVQNKGKFEPRTVKLVKQSESMMVIESGVQAGEIVAMADPTADKKSKNSEKKSSGGNPMGGMPGGK